MKNISILVAEDDVMLRKELVEYMGIFIDTIYEANDGKEALAIYEKYKPNILFADINMPYLNGLDLIEKIRKIDKSIEIVIISAHTDTAYLLRAVELHLASYLVKPIEAIKLKDTLLKSINIIKSQPSIKKSTVKLSNGYYWNINNRQLYLQDKEVKLSSYELLFIECLMKSKNSTVSYESIHNFVYNDKEHGRDAITSLVKRLRQKTSKEIVTACYKEGYKI